MLDEDKQTCYVKVSTKQSLNIVHDTKSVIVKPVIQQYGVHYYNVRVQGQM